MSPLENKALQIVEKGTIFKGDHFEVLLLWKEKIPVLPNNREMALKRFYSLEKKFAKNTLSKANKGIYQKRSCKKKLDKNEMSETSNITNY